MAAVEPALEAYLLNYADIQSKWNEVLEVFGKATVEIPVEVIDQMRSEAPAAVAEVWVTEADQAGLPGRELLEIVQSATASY